MKKTILMIIICMSATVIGWDETVIRIERIEPGTTAADPPSDAIVLFDGGNLDQWESSKKPGNPAPWKLENGYVEVVKDTGAIHTKEKFASCQLHIEFATPEVVSGGGQGRGNSGVFLMSRYEIQVLDNYENDTYAIGYVGAVYGQSPPGGKNPINPSRKPGQWQTYDIIFHAPEFEGNECVRPATMTALLNGVLVQDHFEIQGATVWRDDAKYSPHPPKMPLELQDHSNPVRFRNIWIRPLKD